MSKSKRLYLVSFVIITFFSLVINLLFIGNSKADSAPSLIINGPDKMSINETATLTVSGGCGGPYTWSLSGGGYFFSTMGDSVNYTSPADNSNCENNPIICVTNSAGQKIYKQIDVNAYTDMTQVAYSISTYDYLYGNNIWMSGDEGWCYGNVWLLWYTTYNCRRELLADTHEFCSGTGTGITSGGSTGALPCVNYWQVGQGIIDQRTAAMKAAGCCPKGLFRRHRRR